MEMLLLVIGIIVISSLLAFIAVYSLFHHLNLINATNKRLIFLLEKMYQLMGLTASRNIEDITQEMERMNDEVNDMLNRKPDRYDPHEEVEKMEDLDL